MDTCELLTDAASRPASAAEPVLDGLTHEAAHRMPGDQGNSIAWLLWHAARQMDVQTVALSGGESVWTSGGWAQRLGVDRGEDEFGVGDSPEDVAALHVDDAAALPPIGDDEEEMLDCTATDRTDASRLGCQLRSGEHFSALAVRVPEAQV